MTSFVQSQSLSHLSCTSCKKYLSYFPIYYHPGRGSFCGRCPKPNGEGVIRNQIYEQLAEPQKFPCSYHANGCTENLVPSKIPQHEKFCFYRKLSCPLAEFADCNWLGFRKDLQEHFEQKHPTFLLGEGQFELDFVNSHIENYLFPYGEELFIVNRMNDSKTNIFSITVYYIGINAYVDDYWYRIILKDGTRSHSYELTSKLNGHLVISRDVVKSVLNDPISVVARIEIFSGKEDPEDVEDEEEFNEAVNYDMLRELECLVCLEYMVPPIHQCITGHSVCLKCKEKLTECPSCKTEFKNTQNFALAQIINFLTYPCKYSRCKFTAKAKDIKQHEASCLYGPFQCPLKDYEGCNIEISFQEVEAHVLESHYENLLEMDIINLPFDIDNCQEDEDCYMLKYGTLLFKLHYLYRNGRFYWAMQLLGPAEESIKYKFEIDIIDNSGDNQRAYFRMSCSPLCDKLNAFNDDKSFLYIDFGQIKTMITTEFSYRVRVLLKE